MAAQFMSGNEFDFMGKDNRGILHPVAFCTIHKEMKSDCIHTLVKVLRAVGQ
jgi:hypothetical protein